MAPNYTSTISEIEVFGYQSLTPDMIETLTSFFRLLNGVPIRNKLSDTQSTRKRNFA